MLRFALGGGERGGFRSPEDASMSGVAEGGVRGAVSELAGLGETGSVAAGALRVAAGEGCPAAPGAYTRAATEAKPSTSPAAAAAKIVQRERAGRCESGRLAGCEKLDT
jgi:hypothetical protein